MKINLKALVISLAIPLGVGGLSALLTMENMKIFGELNKPPLSPPALLFPIVWTLLYALMGIALYRVYMKGGSTATRAYLLFGAQLFFNFLWSIIFFNLEWYGIAFVWLLVLLALIVATAIEFYRVDRAAGIMMIPYIVWVVFAGYLNLGIAVLN